MRISAVTTTSFIFLNTARLMTGGHQDLTGGVMIAAAGRAGRTGGGGGASLVSIVDTVVHITAHKVDGSVVLVGEDVVVMRGRLLDDLPGHGVHHGSRALPVPSLSTSQPAGHSLYPGEDQGGAQDDEDGEESHHDHGDDVDTAGHVLLLHHLH